MELELPTIENYCVRMYESTVQDERSKAERALNDFFDSSDTLAKCQYILEHSSSAYLLVLAINAIIKFISKPTQQLALDQKLWLRNYVLSSLYTRVKLPVYVGQSFMQLFAKLTKYNWCEESDGKFVFRTIVEDVTKFLQGDLSHCVLGIELLCSVVEEMNHYEPNRRLNEHRKVTNSFRDLSLLEILTLARDLLRDALDNGIDPSDAEQCELLEKLVKLAYSCLSFDFTASGNSLDDATDEMCTVQIPSVWRCLFVDFKTMDLFFDLYRRLPSSQCATVVSCLGQMAAIRRSLFTNNERIEYFHNLISGIKSMLENVSHLTDSATYHEFCKLLARLRAIYQLSEFVKAPCWADFIRLLAEFTINSLQIVECPANSLHYVLSMWHKLVASVPYMRSPEPHFLEKYAPEISIAYITSRLEHVPALLRDGGLSDPLNDQTILQQQLEQIAIVARCTYKKVAQLILTLYDQTVNDYQVALNGNNVETARIKEYQLTWLVYIIGAVIGARISVSSSEETDTPDAELICRVLCLVNALNNRLPAKSLDQLEISIVSFFDQFRRIYIGEQMQKISNVYITLSEVLGLKDEMMILDLIVNKIMTNLKVWSNNSVILSQTLQLLSDLSLTYSGLRKLAKLEAVQFLLNNHSSETLPFLSINNGGFSGDELRHRTTFYTSLTRLLLVDLSEDDDRFEEFLQPLTISLDTLGQHLSTNGGIFNSEISKRVFIGICRDLRGIVFALNSKNYFNMFFEWLYPTYTPIFHRAMEIWFHDPSVTTPVLKLYCEMVQNRFQRLLFEASPVGVLLFRECSLLLTSYGNHILSATIPKDKEYSLRLKGICICFLILKNALSGNFINFAIFQLYEDKALENSLNMFVKMLLSMSDSNFLQYPKLSLNYYGLLECLAGDHITFLANLDISVFLFILQTVAQGLLSVDSTVCTCCCCTLDLIVTFLYKKLSKEKKNKRTLELPVSQTFLRIIETNSDIFDQMLSSMMNTVIYDELRNQWSMSRPLIGLILLREDYFSEYQIHQIQSQAEEKRAAMTQAFSNLMEGIERNLTNKNKDRFTQNVAVFRRDVGEILRNSKDPISNISSVVASDDVMI